MWFDSKPVQKDQCSKCSKGHSKYWRTFSCSWRSSHQVNVESQLAGDHDRPTEDFLWGIALNLCELARLSWIISRPHLKSSTSDAPFFWSAIFDAIFHHCVLLSRSDALKGISSSMGIYAEVSSAWDYLSRNILSLTRPSPSPTSPNSFIFLSQTCNPFPPIPFT